LTPSNKSANKKKQATRGLKKTTSRHPQGNQGAWEGAGRAGVKKKKSQPRHWETFISNPENPKKKHEEGE